MPSNKGKTENAGLSALLEGLINAGVEFILGEKQYAIIKNPKKGKNWEFSKEH